MPKMTDSMSGLYSINVKDSLNTEVSSVGVKIEVSPKFEVVSESPADPDYALGVDPGTIIKFVISVDGGASPYKFVWSDLETNTVISENGPGSSKNSSMSYEVQLPSGSSKTIQCKVTSADGSSVTSIAHKVVCK